MLLNVIGLFVLVPFDRPHTVLFSISSPLQLRLCLVPFPRNYQ